MRSVWALGPEPAVPVALMSAYQLVALILVVIGPVLAVATATKIPPSLALFGLGLLSTIIPGLPPLRPDPQLLLDLMLPPLVYASTVRVSLHLVRFTLVPGLLLGALIVLVTVGLVALATRFLLLPGLPWTAALLLGVIASVFDTRFFHEAEGRPHVPRTISDTLKARELVSRLFILGSLGLVLETAETSIPSVLALAEHYGIDIPTGLLLGAAIGWGVASLRRRIDVAPIEIAVSVATPYAASLAAALLDVSAVAAITAAALVISTIRIDRRTGAPISSSEARISAVAFWEEISLIVSSVLFLLAGRALPQALGGLDNRPIPDLVLTAAGVLVLVLSVQYAVSCLAPLTRPLRGAGAGKDDPPVSRWAAAGIMTWSSTRSVIGLVIALSIPKALPDGSPFPARDLILVVAALTIIGSILLQGLSVGAVVRLGSSGAEHQHQSEEDEARRTIEAAIAAPGPESADGFDAARRALLRLRERDRIGDEVLISMLRETDLAARATEGDALPGAGPPNP